MTPSRPTPDRVVGQHLAQVNVARLRAPIGSDLVHEFVAALAPINHLAEQSAGFVWRFQTDEGHAVNVTPYEEDALVIVNMSVWESYENLHAFAYRSAHNHFLRRRAEWFDRMDGPTTALWWVPIGHEPSLTEALARIDHLKNHGPAPAAFSVRRRFDARGRPVAGRPQARYA